MKSKPLTYEEVERELRVESIVLTPEQEARVLQAWTLYIAHKTSGVHDRDRCCPTCKAFHKTYEGVALEVGIKNPSLYAGRILLKTKGPKQHGR